MRRCEVMTWARCRGVGLLELFSCVRTAAERQELETAEKVGDSVPLRPEPVLSLFLWALCITFRFGEQHALVF